VTELADLEGRGTCSVEEAAAILGVSRGLAYAAARAGEIPAIRLGRRLLVLVEPLRRMLDGESS